MIISHRHRFVFIKTRKTAGTSVEVALSKHCGPDDIITPIAPEDEAIRAALGYPGPQNFRAPANWRCLAALRRRTRRYGAIPRRRPSTLRFFNHIAAVDVRRAVGQEVWDSYVTFTVERNPFDKAISSYWYFTDGQDPRPDLDDFVLGFDPMKLSNWHLYSNGPEIMVDFVALHERLVEDLEAVSAKLGIDICLPEQRAKGGFRQDHRQHSEVLSPIARSRIERICWRELEAFGYC